MANLPYAWAAYAQFQSRLSRLHKLSDHTWGLEAALNVVFQPDFSPELTSAEEFRRAAASASRKRRRHRARFLANEAVSDIPDPKDMVAQIVTRQALRIIEAEVDRQSDYRLLEGIAFERDYEHLAKLLGQRATTLRSRALRLRRRFAYLNPSSSDFTYEHHL